MPVITLANIGRLHATIVAGGVAISGVDIAGLVTPTSLQAAAQPIINAFDDSTAADNTFAQQQQVKIVNSIFGVRKGADESTTSGTFVDCVGLNFTLAPSTSYKWKFSGAYTAALATTGLQISVNGPSSPNFIRFIGQIFTTTTTILGGVGANYDVAIANTASGGATALPFMIEGTITTGSSSGVFTLRFRSEVVGSAVTILRGSIGELLVVT